MKTTCILDTTRPGLTLCDRRPVGVLRVIGFECHETCYHTLDAWFHDHSREPVCPECLEAVREQM